MNPLPQECSKCTASIQPGAAFCSNCGHRTVVVSAGLDHNRKNLIVVAAVCFGIALAYLVLAQRSSNRTISNFTTSAATNPSTVVSSIAQSSNQLTNDKVERAVSRLTSNLRVAGAITVDGIQELPQDNSAKADLRFTNFQYKSDMAGSPLSSDRQAPEKPQVNDPNFYDKLYKYGTQQVRITTYSGPGVAVLKHYNDGRWLLKEVHWEFNGWAGNVDIR
jgi:zinc ribbon protein